MIKLFIMTKKRLYEVVEATGETLNGSLHIINSSSNYKDEGEGEFRVYHKKGYCFDVKKEKVDLAEDEINDAAIDGFKYSFYCEWEGFDNSLTLKEAFELIKNNSHLPIKN